MKKLMNIQTLPGLILLIGLALSAALFTFLDRQETKAIRAEFQQIVSERARLIEKEINLDLEILLNIRGLFDASDFVSRDELEVFSKPALERHTAIVALEWAPRVPSSKRLAHEIQVKQDQDLEYEIKHLAPGGERIRADLRDEYFPIEYIVPFGHDSTSLGQDLIANPDWTAPLEKARDSGTFHATPQNRILETEEHKNVFLVFLPVYKGNPITIKDRRDRLFGFIIGVFDTGVMVDGAIKRNSKSGAGIEMALFDVSGNEDDRLLHHHESRTGMSADSEMEFRIHFPVADRTWMIVSQATTHFISSRKTRSPLFSFTAGIFLSLLLTGYLRNLSLQNTRIEKLVGIRTAELKQVNNQLQSEVKERNQAQQELKQTERRFRLVVESSPSAMVMVNKEGKIVMVNKALEQLFGYVREELFDHPIEVLIPERFRMKHPAHLAGFFQKPQARAMGEGRDLYGLGKDGREIPIEIGLNPVETEEGLFVLGAIIDNSERKKAQEFMTKQAKEARLLDRGTAIAAETHSFETALQQCIDLVCGSTGFPVGHAYILTGNGSDRLEPTKIWCPYNEKKLGPFRDVTERTSFVKGVGLPGRIWKSGKPAWIEDLQKDDNFPRLKECTHLTFQSAFGFPIRIHKKIVAVLEFFSYEKQEQDKDLLLVLQVLGEQVGRVLERFHAAKALEDAEENSRLLLECAGEGIYGLDPEGKTTFINPAGTRLLGYSESELIGKPMHPLVHHSHPDGSPYPKAQCPMDAAFSDGTIHHVTDEVLWRKDGTCFPVEYTSTPIRKSGELKGAVVIFQDVSERKKIEQMKNEFISTVSHELRTPLTSILGSLSLVAGGVAGRIPKKVKTMLDIAHKNSERLVRLINDILDIEKIEAGKITFTMAPVDLVDLVEGTVEANRGFANQHKVSFTVDQTMPGVKVSADSDRLTQVLTNLLSNAVKFSPSGGTVDISVSRHQDMIRTSVRDRGPGIAKDFQEKVFGKFVQADSSDSRQKGGTGLGLNISKAIIERMEGQIGFSTNTGEGAVFYFDLPEWTGSELAPVRNINAPQRPRILICEDDRDIASVLKMILNQQGFDTDIAYDAKNAKSMLRRNTYKAMTLDILLPGEDGISLIRELRSRKSTRLLPIIVVSAEAEKGKKEINGDALQVIDWLDKPIEENRLVTAIRKASGKRENGKPKILHVEDDPDILQVVAGLLNGLAEIRTASTLEDAKKKLKTGTFDMILLDMMLPDGSGKELIAVLRKIHHSSIPVVVFSAQELDKDTARKVHTALVKSRATNDDLLNTVKSVIGTAGDRKKGGNNEK